MITVENLSKSYVGRTGTVMALDDITLDVPEGTLCGVIGPAGAGKSTLARVVGLQERPDRGAIRVGGTNLMSLAASQLRGVRRQIGVLPNASTLLAQRTVAGNIAMPLEQAGVDGPQRRARVAELLDLAGLTDRAGDLPGTLSAGTRQRVGVARILATGPSVLVADEPTDGLDPRDAAGVLAVLDRARAELGTTVVLATRDAAVVRRLCDDVAVLDGGRLVERGSILDLISDQDSWTASAILPAVPDAPGPAGHDEVANVVLIGFATVGALLPEAASRFGVQMAVLGGGITRLGDTPVARFQLGVTGERACAALSWVAEQGAIVHRVPCGPQGVVAA